MASKHGGVWGFCWIHLGHQFAIGALRAQIASVGTDGSNRNLGHLSNGGSFLKIFLPIIKT